MSSLKQQKIAVILGGRSKERDVSLRSGEAVYQALQTKGYEVIRFDPAEQELSELISQGVGAAFIALHGHYGEDGCIQGALETLKIPYTGANVKVSAICYDKATTKALLKPHGVLMAEGATFAKDDNLDQFLAGYSLGVPVIVKPNCQGSSFGTSIVREISDLKAAIQKSLEFDDRILVEQFIEGAEITVGLFDGKALGSVEIVPKKGFYDYEAKYTAGYSEYFSPARVDDSVQKTLLETSEKVCAILDCEGAPRVDFMVTSSGQCYFLEVNTIPGMTATSLLPKAAKSQGISFEDLCEKILHTADLT